MPTQAKTDIVTGLKARFEESTNIFVTDYAGLNVEQMNKLRKELRDAGIKFVIAKNTLMRIAAHESGYEKLEQHLKGPTALAFSDADPNVPAKILFDTYKEYKDLQKPEVKVFYVDQQEFAGAAAEQLAKLPPREILLSQLVSAVEGPIVNLVGTLDSILREIVGTVDALARKKGEE